jgi:hypothetical protein
MANVLETPTITPAAFARRYSIGLTKVLYWLASGELGGIDVSLGRLKKPRWRIREIDIERFEARRANTAAAAPQPRRTRKETAPAASVAFFPEV